MVVAELLPRIDERHRLRQHERQRGHDSGRIAQPAELAAVPRILVVIGGEHQPHGRTRITVAVGVKVVAQIPHAATSLRDVVDDMVELPRIAGVERTVEKIRLLGFGQHEEIVLHFAQLRRSLLPEGRGHQHGHIAAEPVHAVLREPEAHGVDLPLPHGSVGVVELGRVVPAVGHDRLARRVALVPVGRTLGHPPRVARRVVGHPVEQHFQPQSVRRRHEAVEIGHRPEFGIDAAVVAHGVVGAQRPLAVRLADRVDRHQPHGVDAQLAQAGEMFFGGGESPFGRQLPHVQFIDHRRITPCGMRNMCRFVHFYPIQTAKIGKFGNIRNILLFNPSRGGLSEKK